MSAPHAVRITPEEYDRAAQAYLASLPPEHFMEAALQATQREVTVAGCALLRRARPDFHYFNELLVQYFFKGNLRQVVPDNMVVLGNLSDEARTSYATELEPCQPFWMLEYVSASSKRKDYVDSFQKYERELKVPYYLTFDPETQDLRLLHHDGTSYVPVPPNSAGRYPLPEIELEVGLLDGWARFWHRGALLPLPAELQQQLDEHAERIRELENQVDKQAQQLQDRERELQQRDLQMEAMASMLRLLVEAKALQSGRQDILQQLPATTDGAVLARWLTELG